MLSNQASIGAELEEEVSELKRPVPFQIKMLQAEPQAAANKILPADGYIPFDSVVGGEPVPTGT